MSDLSQPHAASDPLPSTEEVLPPDDHALPAAALPPNEGEEQPAPAATPAPPAAEPSPKTPRRRRLPRWLWQGKLGPAFWTVGAALSFLLNIVLIVALLVLARELFALKGLVQHQMLGGLASNFQKMDEAVIRTEVVVNDTIPIDFDLPVRFDLPVNTTTTVVLTEDTFIREARVNLRTGGLVITDAPTDIVLPAGTELPIRLSIVVPVDTVIPVQADIPITLKVPVAIPLRETELHEPFVGLQEVVSPYLNLLERAPDSWREALCGPDGRGRLCFLAPWLSGER